MKTILLIFSLFVGHLCLSQIGGQTVYSLLELSYNARSVGLGGNFITAKDNDINLGVANPSLLNSEMNNRISLSQAIHAGKLNIGMLSYGYTINDKNTISTHIRYVSYGKMTRMDKAGNENGSFSPFEYVIGAGYSYQLNPRISLGANLNIIGSHLESYFSYGTSIDLAGTYTSKDETFLATALFKNVGFQFNAYNDTRNKLPANFQLGVSYRLKHAPFRFSILAHHLNQWDLTYNDPNAQPIVDMLSGDTIPVKKAGFFEKLGQHFIFQLEVLATKNIHIRAGFDYYGRQTLKLENKPAISGLALGLGLHFKRFSLDYGFRYYSKAGFNNVISFSLNIGKLR